MDEKLSKKNVFLWTKTAILPDFSEKKRIALMHQQIGSGLEREKKLLFGKK